MFFAAAGPTRHQTYKYLALIFQAVFSLAILCNTAQAVRLVFLGLQTDFRSYFPSSYVIAVNLVASTLHKARNLHNRLVLKTLMKTAREVLAGSGR